MMCLPSLIQNKSKFLRFSTEANWREREFCNLCSKLFFLNVSVQLLEEPQETSKRRFTDFLNLLNFKRE